MKKIFTIAILASSILGGGQISAQSTEYKPGTLLRSVSLTYNNVTNRVFEPFVAEDSRFVSEIEVRKLFGTETGAGFTARYTNTIALSDLAWLDIGSGLTFVPSKNSYRWGQFEDARLMVYDRVDHYKSLYVTVPINVKFNLYRKKAWFDLGFQMMVNAYQFNTRTESKFQYGRNGAGQLVEVAALYRDEKAGFRISSFDFGVFGGLEANVTSNIALTGRYYYNVNKLVRLFPDVYRSYAEVGVRYYLNRE